MEFSRRDSLELGAQLDLPVSGEAEAALSPRMILDDSGGVHNQPEILMIEGPAFRRRSLSVQQRANGIINPPATPEAPDAPAMPMLVAPDGDILRSPPSKRRLSLSAAKKRDRILNRDPSLDDEDEEAPRMVSTPSFNILPQEEVKMLMASPTSVAAAFIDVSPPQLVL
mmetsp:Transcript_21016/g.62713  ORF Transcript_21016/g.62713 Transcript_21016/m.62713 type:complete len:169 (+) Transcript_21016:231-737(+)|eukprot:CAMPEP_0119271106 /NCGR_PEP_ID=MMETSP1329-20130426/7828_1 /TAXON_ID=114041 /ORGANISM="Genus nov. species nov., Strain RCC1024" /LENGTH=168 /DNA_ID=CAMNT_0007271147 /DNA_START=224 /DNA_END=730 /DNA_ORIENTATION=+